VTPRPGRAGDAPDPANLADRVDRTAIVELVQALVRIPSVNPAIAPDEAHGEGAIAAFARDWLNARGVRAWLEEAAPGRPNVVAEVGGGEGPTLVLCAHLDTVGTAGMTIPPFDPRVEGSRLYGRGSMDMKGGVAACLSAAAALAGEPLAGRLMLALVADEEHASVGASDFVARHRADGCILTEASEGCLITAHKGFVWADLSTVGRAAHGSRFDLGVSAIARMGRIIAALDRYDREVLRARTHPAVGPASMHCALVEGGAGLSTYAPRCRLTVERRTLPGETGAQVLRELEEVVRGAGEEAEIALRLERAPLACDPGARVARCLREGAREVTGAVPPDAGAAYWMDAAIFAEAGIPAVDYGPDGEGAHEAVEWVDLDSVARAARVLVASARRFCDTSRS
jgi:acetylornithine deacetylase/succinyl-diaminopimelate desuccinylase-like protein